jgi:hypothetical protein
VSATSLWWENVRCVPSIHGRAAFAAEAERAIDTLRPDVVAVELPGLVRDEFLLGLDALPQIQALCIEREGEGDGDGAPSAGVPVGLIVLDPADSIVAAARRARELGIPVECVDVLTPAEPDRPAAGVPDPLLVDHAGLGPYFDLYAGAEPAGRPDRFTHRRERAMVAALRALAARHTMVLAVLGMAHWERVRAGLRARRRRRTVPAADGAGMRVYRAAVAPAALPGLLRHWPFASAHYERHRRDALPYSATAMVTALLVEAQARCDRSIPAAQLTRLGVLVDRLAARGHQLTPTLYDVLSAARSLVGRDYGKSVWRTASSYPQPEPDGRLPAIAPGRGLRGAGARRRGRRILVPMGAGASRAERERFGALLAELDESLEPTASPGAALRSFDTRLEEDLREDRVARAIVERVFGSEAGAVRVAEFRSGLRRGVDARRTARDALTLGRIFVRDAPPGLTVDPDLCGALVIAFRGEDGSRRRASMSFMKDCPTNGPRWWKLGLEATATEAEAGWTYARYAALAILFDTTMREEESIRRYRANLMAKPWTELQLLKAALIDAPLDRPLVVFVSPEPPDEEAEALAAHRGRTIVHCPAERVADLTATIAGYHRLVEGRRRAA